MFSDNRRWSFWIFLHFLDGKFCIVTPRAATKMALYKVPKQAQQSVVLLLN